MSRLRNKLYLNLDSEGRDSQQADEPGEEKEVLAWLPATLPAVALRLQTLDAALAYAPDRPPSRETLQVCATLLRFDRYFCIQPSEHTGNTTR